jgi:hypothetical protein
VNDNVRLPLLSHVTRAPERGELHNEQLEQFHVQEGRISQHLLRNKHDEDQELAKVELIALILCFTIV